MLEYLIAGPIIITILLIGYYLASITQEELKGFFDIFNYSLTIFSSAIIFMVSYFVGIETLAALIIALIFAILHHFSLLIGKIGLSLAIYIFSSFFLVVYFDSFLLACTIILGFLISSIHFYIVHKKELDKKYG